MGWPPQIVDRSAASRHVATRDVAAVLRSGGLEPRRTRVLDGQGVWFGTPWHLWSNAGASSSHRYLTAGEPRLRSPSGEPNAKQWWTVPDPANRKDESHRTTPAQQKL